MQRRLAFLGFSLAIAAAVAGGLMLKQAQAASFELRGQDILVNGTVNGKSLRRFRDFMAKHPDAQRLVLMDMPGSDDDETNLKIGHLVRDLGLDTHVTARSEIFSGAVELFLAGSERTMEAGAVLGVHAWEGDRAADEYPRWHPEHAPYVAYTTRMLGSAQFYWFTVHAAPADGMHIMTEAEIERYGLLTQPVLRD
ncbi:alpha/beta hydrolase [Leisingera daeponensis]|uniref:Alpha/beta hydrolase n=1 Tax=Leisingera daeponensis TaxID=405746 RepID=A0ABS7NCK8_9RHOB|nr:alpha/beta hydrolase [Leisingera daeponensis]MBY6055842.1 alpha/beta hydrolase [Leisingera daeponensis]MBY6138489.1 alpha/beta hydrolase [Leisingera daeponensis]